MTENQYLQPPINWKKLIEEIMTLEPDPDNNWTYEELGKASGASRGIIDRLLKPKDNPRHLEDPKHAQGMALIRIHADIHNRRKQLENDDGN